MTQKRALLVGASGLVGTHCLTQLLSDPTYSEVLSLVRSPLPFSSPKLSQVVIDFMQLEAEITRLKAMRPSDFKIDQVFCCLGTTIKRAGSPEKFAEVDMNLPLRLARLALQSGTELFSVVSAVDADPNSKVFYNRVKGQMEQELAKIGLTQVHVFRPSLLLGNRQEIRRLEKLQKVALSLARPLLFGPMKKYRAIQASAVGIALVKAAHNLKPGFWIYESDQIQKIYNENFNTV